MARKKSPPRPPRIEVCLARAHAQFPALVAARAALIAAGISADSVPNDDALRAFQLLGDYQRPEALAQVEPYSPTLEAKGLVRAALVDTPTPELRLIAAILSQINALRTVWERFEAGIVSASHSDTSPLIRCVASISGVWGQPAQIHFAVTNADWVLVRPGAVFGLHETMVRTETLNFRGGIDLPLDDGQVLIAAMTTGGEVSTHHLHLEVLS